MTSPVLKAAHEYLRLGLHPIPCEPRGKKPLVKWERYQTEAPLPDELDTWWSQWPTANVGLVVGRGMFALDLDGGAEAEHLLVDHGVLLPPAPRVKTGAGQHVYLAVDRPVHDRVDVFRTAGKLNGGGKRPQVDVRGVGYVLAPPSVHPNGATYEWRVPLTLPLPSAPARLLEILEAPLPGPDPSAPGAGSGWVSEALLGVGDGARDATCAKLAGYLLGKGLSADEVETILAEGFAKGCVPPFPRAEVRKTVRSIARREAVSGEPSEEIVAEPISDVLVRLAKMLESSPVGIVPTPFQTLNKYLGGGWNPGELYLFGGRPGRGKTALALNAVRTAADHGHRVLVVSREMIVEAMARRMVAADSGVDGMVLKRGDLDALTWERVSPSLKRLATLPVLMTDKAVTIAQVLALVSHVDPAFLVVDYLQLVRAPKEIKDRRMQVEHVSAELKALTVTTRIPVLCLSSLARIRPNEDGEERPPGLADLRESGALEHDADAVLFIHRAHSTDTEAQLIVEKQRDGSTGFIRLRFEPETQRFYDGNVR